MSALGVTTQKFCVCSESLVSAHSAVRQRVAGAESSVLNRARALSSSAFSRLLRCRKDHCQLLEDLGGRGVGQFVVCTEGSAQSEPVRTETLLAMGDDRLDLSPELRGELILGCFLQSHGRCVPFPHCRRPTAEDSSNLIELGQVGLREA